MNKKKEKRIFGDVRKQEYIFGTSIIFIIHNYLRYLSCHVAFVSNPEFH